MPLLIYFNKNMVHAKTKALPGAEEYTKPHFPQMPILSLTEN